MKSFFFSILQIESDMSRLKRYEVYFAGGTKKRGVEEGERGGDWNTQDVKH